MAHSGEWKTKLEKGQLVRGGGGGNGVFGLGWAGYSVSAAAATVCYGGVVAMTPLIDFTWRPKGQGARRKRHAKWQVARAIRQQP